MRNAARQPKTAPDDAADAEADRLTDGGRDALERVRAPAEIRLVVVGDQ